MRLPAYLSASRHGVFYFRWPLPQNNPSEVRRTIRISLRTRCPQEAKRLARHLAAIGHDILDKIAATTMDHAEVRATVYKYFKAQLETGKQRVNKNGPFGPQQVEHYQQTLGLLKDGNKSFWHTMGREYAQTELDRFYEVTGLSAEECRDIQPMILDEIRKARIGAYEAMLEHVECLGRYEFTAASRALPEAPVRAPGLPDYPSLTEAVEAFFRINEKSSEWTPGTIQKRQAILDLALEWFGPETPMDQIKKRDAADFKEALIDLPVNRSKVFRLRGMSLREMIDVEDFPKISNATINAHLSVYKVFWEWAEKHDYAPEALFQNMSVGKKSVGSKQRAPFTQKALELTYDALTNPHSKFYGKTSHRWATLIAIFTGARRNEICQLQVEDITTEDGIAVFDFNDEGDNLKRIKSAAGNRRVPIHSKLIELGLLQYNDEMVAAGHKRLFPDYSYHPKHGYGDKLSKWFNRTFTTALGIKSEAQVFHGLRHTFATRLGQADVPTEMIQFIIGHERDGVTHQVYLRQGYTVAQSKEAVERFRVS